MVDFNELQISSQAPLHTFERQVCPKCNRHRSFICQDCAIPLTDGVPKVELRVKVGYWYAISQRESVSKTYDRVSDHSST